MHKTETCSQKRIMLMFYSHQPRTINPPLSLPVRCPSRFPTTKYPGRMTMAGEREAKKIPKKILCGFAETTGHRRREATFGITTKERKNARITFGITTIYFFFLSSFLASTAQALLSPTLYRRHSATIISLFPPPGSGYIGPDDEMADPGMMPETYKPLMGYPGTMRPGTTLENMPYQDLPISDTDPDPVPWPHFQEIQWHHRWEPPHPNPDTMEDVIEKAGRWATPEQEAAIRAGARSSARLIQEAAEQKKKGNLVITDDEDDGDIRDEPLALGDGIFGKLGSDDDRALTEKAVSPDGREEEIKAEKTDDGMDDFFADLGLDLELGDDENDDEDAGETSPSRATASDEDLSAPPSNDKGVTASIEVEDDDDELSVLGLDDEEDGAGETNVSLDNFDADEFDTGTENFFDEAGFDFDDDGGGGFDGGDDW